MPKLRMTFLTRFTLVTFVSAAIAAVGLAAVLDNAHVGAVQHDKAIDAASRVEALLAPVIAQMGNEPALAQDELARVAREVRVFNFVDAIRLYDDKGHAIYPKDAPPPPEAARRALAREDLVEADDRTGHRMVFAPLASDNHLYVVAIALSREQLSDAAAKERVVVAVATLVSVGLIFFALVTVAAAASRELERRRRESQATFVDTLGVMARTLDLRDPYTAGHSERVAQYTELIARELKLSDREVQTVRSGALLHDLGKIAVPDAVLFKPAKLDAGERHLIEVHPTVGASILSSVASMEDVVPCVMHHHEKLDGSGYPHRLVGDAIPFGARIIAVADAFDAMTTDRPYRRALTVDAAVDELHARSGQQFDEKCVAAFVACVFRGDVVPPESRGDARFARRIELELPPMPGL